MLRGLPLESLSSASADEVSAVDVVLGYGVGDGVVCAVRVSACMAVVTLGCRNGFAVCANVEVMRRLGAAAVAARRRSH